MLGRITGDIRAARSEAAEELIGKPLVSELHRIGRKLEAAAGELDEAARKPARGRGWHWAVEARVSRRATTVSTAIDEAGALYLPERLHAVRIALKKLRYAVEVIGEATGVDRAADLKALKRAQDLLGRLHDLQVLIDRVRRAQASLDPPDVGGLARVRRARPGARAPVPPVACALRAPARDADRRVWAPARASRSGCPRCR